MRGFFAVLAVSAVLLSCSNTDKDPDNASVVPDTAAQVSNADPDVSAIGGTGVPNGYIGRTDRPDQQLSAA